jgi:excisionase family DNA binding protein
MEKLFTLREIETHTGRAISTLRNDIREGRLKIVRLGRQVRVSERAVLDFIRGRGDRDKAK